MTERDTLLQFARWMSEYGLINANDTAPEALVQEYLLDGKDLEEEHHPDLSVGHWGEDVNQAPTAQDPRGAFQEGVRRVYDEVCAAAKLSMPGTEVCYALTKVGDELRDLFIDEG